MEHPDYNSPQALKSFLEANGMAMQKKFGQNFLINETARKNLIDALDVTEGTKVWEVGPGLGCMTDEMLSRGVNLTVFEIDHGFARMNVEFFKEYAEKGCFSLVEGDVLKTWKAYWKKNGTPDRFFGNLPYNVAATIVADMISEEVRFDKAVVTVQKEVGQRMSAKAGSEDYSSFSVLCQWAYQVKPLMDLAGGNFWPKPNVASRAVVMTKNENFPGCNNPRLFLTMVRALFSNRRKTINNNIKPLLGHTDAQNVFDRANVSAQERAENMTVEQLLKLSDALDSALKEKN